MRELNFALLGFDVSIKPAFYILCGVYALFGIERQEPLWSIASFVGLIFVSILVHELGHALMARRQRLTVMGIRLHGFGGDVRHSTGSNYQNLLVSLAGPGAGFVLAALAYGASYVLSGPVAEEVISQALWINLVWGVFNLLPMYPLDGGNALGFFLSMFTLWAWPVAHGLGTVCGALVALLGFWLGDLFIMLIGGYVAYLNGQRVRVYWTRLRR